MRRAVSTLLSTTGWALLGGLALLGVVLSVVVVLSASPSGGRVLAARLTGALDGVLAGKVTLEAVHILPRGGLELTGLQVHDPDGQLVIDVPRARLLPDLTGLARHEMGVRVEIASPSLLLSTDRDGQLSLARAFAPKRPAPAGAAPGQPTRWSLGLTRVTVRGGTLRWQREGGTAAAVSGIDLDAEGAYRKEGGFLRLSLRGNANAPAPANGPLSIALAARLQGKELEVSLLEASLGSTSLKALADANVATRAFRVAVLRLGLAAASARVLAPAAELAGDVAGQGYAESDGELVTAALDVRRAGGGASEGTALVAVAARLVPALSAVGFEVALAAFDPSRLLAQAPPGRLTLTARGALAGRALSDARLQLALEVAPSRLRGGEVGPLTLVARAGGGLVEVDRLEARLTGLIVKGSGRWRDGGAVQGDLAVAAADLGRLRRNLTELTGVSLPPLDGRLVAHAILTGTAAAPSLSARFEAPLLRLGGAAVEGARLSLQAAGPLPAARARLTGRVARAEVEGTEGRRLDLSATAGGGEATFSLSAILPGLGTEPAALKGAARLSPDRRSAELRELTLRWPGATFVLARPAVATFAPPAVDRLELASGPRHVVLSGGLGRAGALDARLEVVRLDLARLPHGLVPREAGLRGELSLDARVTGTQRTPTVAAHLTVVGGEARGLSGLDLVGDVRWDGAAAGLAATLRLLRASGGSLDLAAGLSLSRERRRAPFALTVEAAGWPVEVLRQAAGLSTVPLRGTLGAHLAVSGTPAAPALEGTISLHDAGAGKMGPIAAAVKFSDTEGMARVTAATRLAGTPLLDLDARLPLDLAGLLRNPERNLLALARAPLSGSIEVPGLELAALAGQVGLPDGLTGRVSGTVLLGGTARAPRGQATLSVAGGAVAGYRDLAAHLEVAAEATRTAVTLHASLGGTEALLVRGALGAPFERLSDQAALRAAPFTLEGAVSDLALARAAGVQVPLSGMVSAKLVAKGTLARPEARLDLSGKAVELEGRPLGDVEAVVRCEAPTCTAELSFRSATGGVLWAGGMLAASPGLGVDPRTLEEAAAQVSVKSDQLDLGFLEALARGRVRKVSGLLSLDLAASGRLAGLRPRGSVKLTDGRLAVAGAGDWSNIALDGSLGERAIEVSRFEARRGQGQLSGKVSVRDLGTPLARFEGGLVFRKLLLTSAGIPLATLDLPVELAGTLGDTLLDTTITLGAGSIRVPKKAKRPLQSLEPHPAITEDEAAGGGSPTSGAAARGAAGGLEVRCHLLIPGKLVVKGEKPAVDLELKGDSTWHLAGGSLTVKGGVETVRGSVEPMAGRLFTLERGRVTFPGGAPKEALLDVVARYDNPAAVVTVTVSGSALKPSMQFTSRPPLDDATIAILLATGHAEVNSTTGTASGTGAITAQDAGTALANAAVGAVFSGLMSDKLPVDQLSLDTSTLRAGKYITDKIFVGYAYHFNAKTSKDENVNEAKGEYQITPRWKFELRYGDAQAGDASLIWSRDY